MKIVFINILRKAEQTTIINRCTSSAYEETGNHSVNRRRAFKIFDQVEMAEKQEQLLR